MNNPGQIEKCELCRGVVGLSCSGQAFVYNHPISGHQMLTCKGREGDALAADLNMLAVVDHDGCTHVVNIDRFNLGQLP